MRVGSKAFIKRSRWIRKSIGGGLRQAGVVSAAARVAVEETFLGGRLEDSHRRAKEIAGMWEKMGGKLQMPVETNMVWFDLKAAGLDAHDFIALAQTHGLRTLGGRLVVHYQICDEAVERLSKLMEDVLKKDKKTTDGAVPVPPEDMQINVE